MIIKRKLFSFKRTLAGIKGGLKYVPKGAMAGAMFIPGNGIAYLAGKKKLALGITATGALLGGLGGYAIGRSNALEGYDYDERMKKDPKFRALEEKRMQEELKKFQNSKCPVFPDTSHFKTGGKKYGIEIEPIVFKYFNWLEKFYKKNWSKWHKSITSNDDIWSLFSYIFLMPTDKSWTFMDAEEDNRRIAMILWDPEGQSDHQFMYYNPDNEYDKYDFPLGFGHEGKTLIESLTKYVSQFSNWKELNQTQKSIVQEYLNGIKTLGQ